MDDERDATGDLTDAPRSGPASGRRRALLFDFFGTLVEYQSDLRRLGAPEAYRTARSLGFGGDHDEFVAQWDATWRDLGRSAQETLHEFSSTHATATFATAAGLSLTDEQVDELTTVAMAEWVDHIRPVPGASELIRRLSPSWSIAVVSNTNDRALVPELLRRMEIADRVDAVVLSIEHGRIKPHASIYQHALTRLDADPARTCFVGDTYDADYDGPRRQGMRALLIDPQRRHALPEHDRLMSVRDVEGALADATWTT